MNFNIDENSEFSSSPQQPSSRAASGKSRSSRPPSAKSLARHSETSLQSLGAQMIQPWATIKSLIARSLGSRVVSSLPPLLGGGDPSAILTPEDAKQLGHTPMTLAHGFQQIRSMENGRPGIKQVYYLPNSSTFVSLDKEYIQTWKGGLRISKVPIVPPPIMSNKDATISKYVDGFLGVTKWIYVDSYRLYVVANQQLELKVLDLNFKTMSVASSPKPILHLEFCEKTKTVICGEIGGVSIYRIQKQHVGHLDIHVLQEHMRIEKELEEEWVSFVYYEHRKRCLYAGCGSSIYVFDYETGQKIDSYHTIHELSITCISFYEPSEYLITGAKDGSIKIWNVRKSLLFDFHDHYHAITGFMLVENVCGANWGTLPLLVSSSLDATIRMWNIETGQALYRVETTGACLGIRMIKMNLFFHYTESSIQLWNFNRFHHTFAVLLSKSFILKKYNIAGHPGRLLTASTDGSIRILSVLSGTNLGTGYPTNKELTLSQIEYDVYNETIYALNTNGTIVVYDSSVNPFQITGFWDNSRATNQEVMGCITGADFYNCERGVDREVDERIFQRGEVVADYVVFGGADSGQIHRLVFEKDREKHVPIIQAHSSKITMLYFDVNRARLVSGALDGLVKVWNIALDFKKSNTITKSSEKRLEIQLTQITVISIDSFDNYPSFAYALCAETEQLGMHCHGNLLLTQYDKSQTLKAPGLESQETAKLIGIITTSTGKIWAANYDDSSVKVWDSKGVMIRDIQFNETVSCVCFANERGDMLVGLSNEINLVRIQDYMPPHYLKQLYQLEFADDEDEMPLVFNQDVDIWQFEKEAEPVVKHTGVNSKLAAKNDEILNMNFDDLMELSKTRRDDAIRRKNKRQFLDTEKKLYNAEMERRAAALKARAEKLLHKDQSVPDIVIEAPAAEKPLFDLYDMDEPEPVYVKPKTRRLAPSANKGGKKNEGSKTKTFMDRFKVDDGKSTLEALPPAHSRKASNNNLAKNIYKAAQKEKNKKTKVKNGAVPDLDALAKESSNDSSDSEDSFTDSDESGSETHPIFGETEAEKEAHHQDLIDASAKEFELTVEAHDMDLKLKKAKELALQKAQEAKSSYQMGMTLPNSLGIATVLQGRRGSRALVKGEQLFQQQDLEGMYERTDGTSSTSNKNFKKDASKFKRKPKAKPDPSVLPEDIDDFDKDHENEIGFQPLDEGDDRIIEDGAEDAMNDDAILASIAEMKEMMKTPTGKPKPKAEEGGKQAQPGAKPKTPTLTSKFDFSWKPPTDEDIALQIQLSNPALRSMSPLSAKEEDDIFETHKTSHHPLRQEISTEMAAEDSTASVVVLGDGATKNLMKLHGLDGSERAKTPKKKKKAKKNLDANGNEILFDPYVQRSDSPKPFKLKLKNAKLKSRTLKDSIFLNEPKPNTPKKPSSPLKPKSVERPFFPKGRVFASRDAMSEKDVVQPILNLLSNANTPLTQNININTISLIVRDQLRIGDPKKVLEALDALVALHRMFADDVNEEQHFDTFVAPLLDCFLSEDAAVRKKVINSLGEMGIRHDNALTLLICALNERDKTVVQAAIEGLAHYGIADKEGLKRGMVELGMMKGVNSFSNNESLELLAIKIKRDQERSRLQKNMIVEEWVKQTPPTPQTLNRNDSYMDTLAGPFFPPDAHDFNAKQRALTLAAEANVGFDRTWRRKYMTTIVTNTKDEPFSWTASQHPGTLERGIKGERVGSQGSSIMLLDSKGDSKIQTRKVAPRPKIKGSPAHFALVMSRALGGGGGLPPRLLFPKLKIVEKPITTNGAERRPHTVYVPTIILKKQQSRPFTTGDPQMSRMRDLKV